jgi:hypothetical protein
MRFHLPCGVLALVIGASAAQAQTVITGPVVGQPVGTVMAAPPAETIQTIQTIRTVRVAPLPPVRRQVVTTRTITRRVIPAAPAVVAGTVAAALQPLYDAADDAAVPAAVPARAGIYAAPDYDYADYADYGAPLYDVAPAATVAPAPLVAAPVITAPVIYRYVYEPDRILVIDPTTNIAVQAIPR